MCSQWSRGTQRHSERHASSLHYLCRAAQRREPLLSTSASLPRSIQRLSAGRRTRRRGRASSAPASRSPWAARAPVLWACSTRRRRSSISTKTSTKRSSAPPATWQYSLGPRSHSALGSCANSARRRPPVATTAEGSGKENTGMRCLLGLAWHAICRAPLHQRGRPTSTATATYRRGHGPAAGWLSSIRVRAAAPILKTAYSSRWRSQWPQSCRPVAR
mmetsp:Transcript_34474/g.85959  ORF Transcript_34474/g.85959 Transcript_34474/m.85959 type:complete len:218 (-) Transcript_34474:69-722(-)